MFLLVKFLFSYSRQAHAQPCYLNGIMPTIDLNADAGESFGAWQLGDDDALVPQLSSVNLACGFHAGDSLTMRRGVALARKHGVAVGAHPGFDDLPGFGRRELAASPDEVYADVLYQVGALAAFLRAQGGALHHVKAHGALYLKMLRDAPTAAAVAAAVRDFDPELPLVVLAGPGGELMAAQALEVGLRVVTEAFPDRSYGDDGRLAPRSTLDAVIHDPQRIAARALEMASGTLTARSGRRIPVSAGTLCLHGDTPHAAAAARAVRETLAAAGVGVRAF